MRLRSLFWNADERRLRAGWRLLLYPAALALTTLPLVLAASGLLAGGVPEILVSPLAVLAVTIGVVAGTGVAGRYLDRRAFADFGFRLDRDWWLDLGFGLALGAALMTGIFLVELALGWVRVVGVLAARGVSFPVGFSFTVLLFCCVGLYEELIARGYLLTNAFEGLRGYVDDGTAVAAATVVSALVFAGAHGTNPNATAASILGILAAGIFLAAGYVLTGELALPIGVHVTWNTFQGAVFGFRVSGLDVPASVLALEQRGPALFTGGPFGPEAGLLGVAAAAVGTAAVVRWVRWRRGAVRVAPSLRAGREAPAEPDGPE